MTHKNKNNTAKKIYQFTLRAIYDTDKTRSADVHELVDYVVADNLVDAYSKCLEYIEKIQKIDNSVAYTVANIENQSMMEQF